MNMLLTFPGSGGHMADLEIEGGRYGLNIGNQQFTIRNVKISKAQIGISQIWDWGFLYSEMYISDCGVAFSMISGWEQNKLQIGSVVFIDSEIKNCPVFTDSVSLPGSCPVSSRNCGTQIINQTNTRLDMET